MSLPEAHSQLRRSSLDFVMPFMPFNILGIWFRGLLSVAILAGGIYLLYRWYDESHVVIQTPSPATKVETPGDGRPEDAADAVPARRLFRFDPGLNRPTYLLAAGCALLAWATAGRWIGHGVRTLMRSLGVSSMGPPRAATAEMEPDVDPTDDRGGEVHTIPRPDGSVLRVECYGPVDAPPIVFTHGWGADGTAWFYQKKYLAERFRLIVWDLPGAGLSKKPTNDVYRLENLAAGLKDVIDFAGGRPALLVGHSIGGMTTLTFCKEFPEWLRHRVAGLVLVHTTYTNPVRTTRMAGFYTAIERPVIIPLLYLTIALWPLVWAMNWLGYLNGSVHRSTNKESFSGRETRGQLDFIARLPLRYRPDVLARGMLGMISYDATNALPMIDVPTLVVVGDQDTTTLPEAGEYIASHVPSAELVTLSPAKHMGLFEHHGRFDQLVSRFTADRQAGAAVA
jgi:pimeloyl-ACP methyl ester carboxylesterase